MRSIWLHYVYTHRIMRPSTNRLRSAPFQGANTGSSPVGCTRACNALLIEDYLFSRCWASLKTAYVLCRCGGMVDTLGLEPSIARCAGSSPVIGTNDCDSLLYIYFKQGAEYHLKLLLRMPKCWNGRQGSLKNFCGNACGFKSHFRYQRRTQQYFF